MGSIEKYVTELNISRFLTLLGEERLLTNMVEIRTVVENRIANLKNTLDGTSGRAL